MPYPQHQNPIPHLRVYHPVIADTILVQPPVLALQRGSRIRILRESLFQLVQNPSYLGFIDILQISGN